MPEAQQVEKFAAEFFASSVRTVESTSGTADTTESSVNEPLDTCNVAIIRPIRGGPPEDGDWGGTLGRQARPQLIKAH